MNDDAIESILGIVKAEMMVEQLETVDRKFIKGIVLRAGGKASEVQQLLDHPSVKEIDEDLFYIKR